MRGGTAGSADTTVIRPRARGFISATPICGQSRLPAGAVADHRHEPSCVGADLDTVGQAEHHLQYRARQVRRSSSSATPIPGDRRSASRQVPDARPGYRRCATSARHPHRTASVDAPTRLRRQTARFDRRSAVAGPAGPMTSTPIARPPAIRTRGTRVPDRTVRLCRAEAAPRNAAPGPARTPSTMLSGTAPIPVGRPCDPPSLRSGNQENPALRAASTKIAVLPTISRVRRTGIGPLSPCADRAGNRDRSQQNGSGQARRTRTNRRCPTPRSRRATPRQK